jgi:hypothetical protein
MSAERFHTRLRNGSTHMCNGKGKEGKGRDNYSSQDLDGWLAGRNAREPEAPPCE